MVFLIHYYPGLVPDRTQQVKINVFLSDPFPVPTGVPQGSHISSLLFTIFIIYVGSCFRYCDHLFFTDDIKLSATVFSPVDCSRIQSDLDNLFVWCLDNGLKLNTSKCLKISYTRSRIKIDHDYYIHDEKLVEPSFSYHIEKSCAKALKVLGFLVKSAQEFNNELCLQTLYESLVRPLLEFCSVLWNLSQISII
ncbi:unnamed protein product [Macrosiphum euphorbiae]|uniref:Reverse transcriptase domain-containing protein n=1 Tax=Macrosiphum euphorbiae TaxID=13131 RepID=A0AAV0W499_9HEMI|nr:unnamed protein product [Macrosiphum euphorbiae]